MSMTISKAARTAGVSVETVRFYERKGLIEQPPKPAFGGFRVYPPETVARVRFIRQAQELGFSLREVHELLALSTDLEADCADVRRQTQGKLSEVNGKIVQLQRIRTALELLIEACPGEGTLKTCPIIEALADAVIMADKPSTAVSVGKADRRIKRAGQAYPSAKD